MNAQPLRNVVLTVIDGRDADRRIWLSQGESFVVGRTADSDFSLASARQVSNVHFRLVSDQRCCRIIDLETTNGTFLNGKRIAKATLSDGDVVTVGNTKLAVKLHGGVGRSESEGAGEMKAYVVDTDEETTEASLESKPTLAALMADLC